MKTNKKEDDELFSMIRQDWCEKCSEVTLHVLQLQSGNELEVSYRKVCNDCCNEADVHDQLGLNKIDVYWTNCSMATNSWNFLVVTPNYYDP